MEHELNACCGDEKHFDWVLWGSLAVIAPAYLAYATGFSTEDFAFNIFDIMNKMWWGIALGIFFMVLLSFTPKAFVMKVLGVKPGLGGVLRATVAGLVFDLCSHGILLIAMKLYQRGARLSQIMAFLVASPWNSLSLTMILIAMIGWKWTLLFTALSAVIAIITGLVFEWLVLSDRLPENPHTLKVGSPEVPESKQTFKAVLFASVRESAMLLRWLFLGVVIATVMRTFVPADMYQQAFGPSILGLVLTLVFATIVEVCSEGAVPIAADIFVRAGAPGNAFAFLMTGVSTDYTEIMMLKETTKSWKIALFLPLVTVPQVVALSLILNFYR